MLDTYARLLAPLYEKKLKARLIIENRQGAGTILGSNALKAAAPDGRTLGSLSASGLLVAAMTGDTRAPHPAKDFTILGRIAGSPYLLATGGRSSIETIDDVLEEARTRPIIFGITEVSTSMFVSAVITSWLLGIDSEFVAGYRGGLRAVMGAVRGEVDLIAYPIEPLQQMIRAGDMRLLLQISDAPISSDALLKGVPLLGGDNGLAARRALELGRDVEESRADARALAGIIAGGQLMAAPRGLEEGLFRCLEQKLYQALIDPAFEAAVAKLGWPLDVARADVAIADLQAVAKSAEKFIPIVKEAIKKVQR
jgi:tripartite-type tricarboxylate transporter receptor subunit TctC